MPDSDIDGGPAKKDTVEESEEALSLKANMRTMLKNIKLTVNRMHIRFEDDYFSSGEERQWEPFSLGLVIEKLVVATSDTEW